MFGGRHNDSPNHVRSGFNIVSVTLTRCRLTSTSLAWCSSAGRGAHLGTCHLIWYPSRMANPNLVQGLLSVTDFQYVRIMRLCTSPVLQPPAMTARLTTA